MSLPPQQINLTENPKIAYAFQGFEAIGPRLAVRISFLRDSAAAVY